MEINVIVQYNGGLLPDVVILGNPFDTMQTFRLYSQYSHLNLWTSFPLKADAQKVEMCRTYYNQNQPKTMYYIIR